MSKYTTEVRFICEDAAGLTESAGFNSIEDKIIDPTPGAIVYEQGILSKAAEKIFDFPFPIFDEAYRVPLEKKILRHYYTREICEETVGLWKLRLSDRLNMIMPYYNQMYTSELLKFNPLYDVELSRSHTGVKDSEENTNATNTNTSITNADRTRHGESERTGDSQTLDSTNTHKVSEDSASSEGSTFTSNEQSYDGRRDEARADSKDGNSSTTGSTSGNTTSDEVSSNTDASERWDKYSETPQGAVTGLANDEYLTNARNVKDTKYNGVVGRGNTNVTEDNSSSTNNTEVNIGTNNAEESYTNTENGNAVSTTRNSGNADEETNSNSNSYGQTSESGKVDDTESSSGIRRDAGSLTGKNTIFGTESYTEYVMGKQGSGSYSRLLMEFRQTFLNIDAMVIEELSDLFFGLW